MESTKNANEHMKTALGDHDQECKTQTSELSLNNREKRFLHQLKNLNEKKLEAYQTYSNANITDEDVIDLNVGVIIIAANQIALAQVKGSRLETLFSGHWDKKLQRDHVGHTFFGYQPCRILCSCCLPQWHGNYTGGQSSQSSNS